MVDFLSGFYVRNLSVGGQPTVYSTEVFPFRDKHYGIVSVTNSTMVTEPEKQIQFLTFHNGEAEMQSFEVGKVTSYESLVRNIETRFQCKHEIREEKIF